MNMDAWFADMQAKFYGQAQEIVNRHMMELRVEIDTAHEKRQSMINDDLAQLFGLNGSNAATDGGD